MAILTCDHDDYVVCYDGNRHRLCPACDLKEENEDLQKQIEELERSAEE